MRIVTHHADENGLLLWNNEYRVEYLYNTYVVHRYIIGVGFNFIYFFCFKKKIYKKL